MSVVVSRAVPDMAELTETVLDLPAGITGLIIAVLGLGLILVAGELYRMAAGLISWAARGARSFWSRERNRGRSRD